MSGGPRTCGEAVRAMLECGPASPVSIHAVTRIPLKNVRIILRGMRREGEVTRSACWYGRNAGYFWLYELVKKKETR